VQDQQWNLGFIGHFLGKILAKETVYKIVFMHGHHEQLGIVFLRKFVDTIQNGIAINYG